jgi:hypothetical protein
LTLCIALKYIFAGDFQQLSMAGEKVGEGHGSKPETVGSHMQQHMGWKGNWDIHRHQHCLAATFQPRSACAGCFEAAWFLTHPSLLCSPWPSLQMLPRGWLARCLLLAQRQQVLPRTSPPRWLQPATQQQVVVVQMLPPQPLARQPPQQSSWGLLLATALASCQVSLATSLQRVTG